MKEPLKQPLKNALRDSLDPLRLSPEQLKQLAKLQREDEGNSSTETQAERERKSTRRVVSADSVLVSRTLLVSSAALLLLLSVVLTRLLLPDSAQQTQTSLDRQQVQLIAEEVANSHIKMKPLEIAGNSIEGVQRYFDKLDFLPQLSRLLAENRQNTLAGGRYCSIQGISAAQLRYKSATDKDIILFETVYDPRHFSDIPDIDRGEKPLVTYAKGVKVSLWVEKGLLMVQTEQP